MKVRFVDVSKVYQPRSGAVEALMNVSLDILPGTLTAITGPSGSGKSTLLNIASLLDSPSSGKLFLDGVDTTTFTEQKCQLFRASRIGMMFQQFHLLPWATVLENVLFRFRYASTTPPDATEQARALLDRFGLLHAWKRPAKLLSGGEKQRTALARTLIGKPAFIVADEPTGNLDAENSTLIMNALREQADAGISVLLVTHNETLLRYADRHFCCENGKVSAA